MKEGVEYLHPLRCSTTDESRLSEKKCKRCLWLKAGAESTTSNPKKEKKRRFLGGPYGWNMISLISRKKNEAEVKGRPKIDLVEGSAFKRQIFAPQTLKEYLIQPPSVNGVAVHPLRQQVPIKHPLRSNEVDELVFSVRPSKTIVAFHPAEETEQIIEHNTKQHAPYHNPAAALQNAELSVHDRQSTARAASIASIKTKQTFTKITSIRSKYRGSIAVEQKSEVSLDHRSESAKLAHKVERDIKHNLSHKLSIPSQYRGSVAATQKAELLFDRRTLCAKVERKAKSENEAILNSKSTKPLPLHKKPPLPAPLKALIPELQSYTPSRSPIDSNKLTDYFIKVAARPRPHKPLFTEENNYLYRQTAIYKAVRDATAATLQEEELVPKFEHLPSCLISGRKQETPKTAQRLKVPAEELPSCLVPGRKQEAEKTPRHETKLRRKKSFDGTIFAQAPSHFDVRRQDMRIQEKIPHREKISKEREDTRPVTRTPKTPSPTETLQRIKTSPSRADSRARPGWEIYSPESPLSPTLLAIRKKTSSRAISLTSTPETKRTEKQSVPRIPKMKRLSPLRFDGTLLEGFEGVAKPKSRRPRPKTGWELYGRFMV